jgi:hypothetical protein
MMIGGWSSSSRALRLIECWRDPAASSETAAAYLRRQHRAIMKPLALGSAASFTLCSVAPFVFWSRGRERSHRGDRSLDFAESVHRRRLMAIGSDRCVRLDTVAEGIETDMQRTVLRDMGCTEGQGYLWAKPLDAEQLAAYLKVSFGATERPADNNPIGAR